MNTCVISPLNSFRMRTYAMGDFLKSPGMNTYAKYPGGGGSYCYVRRQKKTSLAPSRSQCWRLPKPFAKISAMPPTQPDTVVRIRPAKEADAPLVLEFIRKLAEYGDIASEATVNEAEVRSALFGPRPVAEAILAYAGSEPAGFAVYSFTFSSFMGKAGIYVEDLFVENQFRGKGIGKALLVTLARLGRERGCGRLEWSVLNWNEQAMEFYQDLGAVPMDEWTTFRLTGDALDRLASPALAKGMKP
jgi:GNAT superfamily N-acetyltransferase